MVNIGEQIKSKRLDRNLTQEELAQKLTVARSTISNWEVSRNYPDIEMIVTIADVLDITLDELLRGDKIVVKKIAEDTRRRKKMTVLVYILGILLTIFVIWNFLSAFYFSKAHDISEPEQIVDVILKDDNLHVATDLPLYKSITGYFLSSNQDNDVAVILEIIISYDFSFKNVEYIKINDVSDVITGEITTVLVTDADNTVETIKIKPIIF